MGNFKELKVWQGAKTLAVDVYKVTNQKDFGHDYSLVDQIRKSAVSIASNVAEGDERNTNKEAIRFFYIATGSIAELITQLTITHEIGYIDDKIYKDLTIRVENLSKQIKALIKHRSIKNE